MGGRSGNYAHLVRMAGLFVVIAISLREPRRPGPDRPSDLDHLGERADHADRRSAAADHPTSTRQLNRRR